MKFCFEIWVSAICIFISLASVCSGYSTEAAADQVFSLPRATSSPRSNQFSGFLNISSHSYDKNMGETHGKYIHYYYIESERSPETDSVVFWTNGGPGCSGLLGLFTEFGPWRPLRNRSLVYNPHTWTSEANIVFLEQPAGVGFSYTTDTPLRRGWNDYRASTDNLATIHAFFERHPQRAGNDIYIASESYGGHYMPQLSLELLDDETLRGRFKGMLVGNPFTSFASGSIASVNAMWGLQLVPKPTWDLFVEANCADLNMNIFHYPDECWSIINTLFAYTDELNPYALDFPVCAPYDGDDRANHHDEIDTQGEALFATPSTSSASKSAANSPRYTKPSAQARMQLKILDKIRKSREFRMKIKSLQKEVDAGASEMPVPDGDIEDISAIAKEQLRRAEKKRTTSPSPYVPHQPLQCLWQQDANSQTAKGTPITQDHPMWRRASAGEEIPTPLAYDPCVEDLLIEYMKDPAVQDALHVSKSFRPTFPGKRGTPDSGSQSESLSSTDNSDNSDNSDSFASAGYSTTNRESRTEESIQAKRDPALFVDWDFCSDVVFDSWTFNDYIADTTHLYGLVYTHKKKPENFKMLVFSGDSDGVCATIGTQNWVYGVGDAPITSLHQPWSYVDHRYHLQQGGFLTKFKDSFSFATVHYAGHEVPAYQPEKALELFRRYIDGSIFDK